MSAGFLFEIAFKSALVSGAALLALRALRGRSAAERSWVAHACLLATLALPLLLIAAPGWRVDIPASLASFADDALQTYGGPAPAHIGPSGGDAEADTEAGAGPRMAPAAALPILAAAPATLLLLGTLAGVGRLFAVRRRAIVVTEPAWLSALAHAQRRMGVKHGTALLVSRDLASPISWGVVRPVIVVNEDALAQQSEAEAIIAHELAHVAHIDWAKLLLGRIATALFWFNPLVWLLAAECGQLREEAADDAVLRNAPDGAAYAALLLGSARRASRGALLAANGVAPRRGSLQRRIARVLDGSLRRDAAHAGWKGACAAATLAVAVPLSALTAAAPDAGAAPQVAPRPDAQDLALMSAREVDQDYADAIRAVSPAHAGLTPQQLLALYARGVTAEWLRELAALGYRDLPPDAVMMLANRRISPDLIRELASLGYDDLSVEEVTTLHGQGVTPGFIRELAGAGYPDLSLDELAELRAHGVSAAYIREMTSAGYGGVTVDELTELRARGVTAGFVRELAAAGHAELSVDALADIAMQGTPAASPDAPGPAP